MKWYRNHMKNTEWIEKIMLNLLPTDSAWLASSVMPMNPMSSSGS